eukprot:7922186-Lingulodinium_polyedra.AAC.1
MPRAFRANPPPVRMHIPLEEARGTPDRLRRALPDVADAAFAVGGMVHHCRLEHNDRAQLPEVEPNIPPRP